MHAVFTHAVMAPGAIEQLVNSPLDRLVTSDTVPTAVHSRLEVVRTAPLLASALRGLVRLGEK